MSNTQTIFRPRTEGNNWAYWRVKNLADMPAATKRCRNRISFILDADGVAAQGAMTCIHCHDAIDPSATGTERGTVYGDYNPRTRMARLWHYSCGWGALLSDIIIDGHANRILAPENIQL